VLPVSLKVLQIEENRFSGALDLTQLPPQLESCGLNENMFSGETDFSILPRNLKYLNVRGNRDLSGAITSFYDLWFVFDHTQVKDKRKYADVL